MRLLVTSQSFYDSYAVTKSLFNKKHHYPLNCSPQKLKIYE